MLGIDTLNLFGSVMALTQIGLTLEVSIVWLGDGGTEITVLLVTDVELVGLCLLVNYPEHHDL